MYKRMPEYDEPYGVVTQIPDFYMEMTKTEASVLCGLIKEYRPKKILELGVAAGGSTCLIMKCLEFLGLFETSVYSLDLNEQFYHNKEKETGCMLKDNKELFPNYDNHTFMLGKLAVDRMDEIGDAIDLLFMDTMHLLPGEILDFLLLYPRLSPNAIVVLHDTNLHNISGESRIMGKAISNRVLVNTVTANKFYTDKMEYLNIGAFQIIEDTKKYIADVFAALLLPWSYFVDPAVVQKYKEAYEKCYPAEILAIYDNAIEATEIHYKNEGKVGAAELDKVFCSGKKVFVYGCGYRGKKVLGYAKEHSYTISGMLVSDGINIEAFTDIAAQGEKIYHFSEIPVKPEECIIILATAVPEVRDLLAESVYEYAELENEFFWWV